MKKHPCLNLKTGLVTQYSEAPGKPIINGKISHHQALMAIKFITISACL